MKIEEYNQIRAEIRRFRGLTKDCAKMLFAMFSKFPENTLRSILNQETQWKMKITHKQIYCNEEFNFYNSFLEAFQRGDPPGIIRNMAIQLNTCPAMLARRVLEEYYKTDENVGKSDVQKMMRDTTLITHASLAYEVYLCVLYDDQYGAIANSISDSIGEEYEIKLERYLKERSIPYYNEDDLRTRGYDKTPDIRLEVPIAVNGFVINWIESKAQFGSPDNHVKYKKEQFLSYWNRFGSGLVLYWFGFVDNIVKSDENRFIVMDHFPENITYMDPYSISPSPV